ncbi:MAG: hypothetical protein P1U85_00615 [Verrucomicrobiales bacterium]|nr:hypothetical protein [Verrucomicrobiales bacterium]
MEQSKIAALASIRNQLGKKITTGAEWMRVQESREDWQDLPELIALKSEAEDRSEEQSGTCCPLGKLSLGQGIPRGQLTEIIERGRAEENSKGTSLGGNAPLGGAGLVMAAILEQARRARHYLMLFDVGSGFSVESFPEQDLESLLWVGCASASEAIEALDIASRDENFSLFLLDFRNCEPGEWRSVRPQQWYRVLGQMRQRRSAAVVFSETPVTTVSKQKWEVQSVLSCQDLYRERAELCGEMRIVPAGEGIRLDRRKVDYREKVG